MPLGNHWSRLDSNNKATFKFKSKLINTKLEIRLISTTPDITIVDKQITIGKTTPVFSYLVTCKNESFYFRTLEVPVIGALRGPAIGAGACLAIAGCDMRVAEPSTKIAFNFLKIGLHPGFLHFTDSRENLYYRIYFCC